MLGAAATAFVSSANAAQAQPGSRDAMRREVESRTRAMSAAFARADMRAVAAFYADDGEIYTPGGAVIRGRRAIDRFWDHVQHPKSWTMTTILFGGSTDEPHQLVESELVHEDDASRSVSRVYCLFIWQRGTDGKLRVRVDMFTPIHD
jgi:ketosteroid isomerase-like protein